MLSRVAPAFIASAWPSPVYSQVRGDLERLADAPGGEHHRRGLEDDERAVLAGVADGARDAAAATRRVVLQQCGDRGFGEDLHQCLGVAVLALVLLLQRHDLLLQGADHLQPGAVTDVGQARVLVAAEVPLADPAVRGAVEQRPVGLQLPDPVRSLLRVQLGHPPVVEELAAAHRVAVVHLPVVLGVHVAHGRRGPTLGHHRVRLAEQRLADDGRALALQPRLDGRPQAGPAGADHHDVETVALDLGHRGFIILRRTSGGWGCRSAHEPEV
jgi:hypothetical protein